MQSISEKGKNLKTLKAFVLRCSHIYENSKEKTGKKQLFLIYRKKSLFKPNTK